MIAPTPYPDVNATLNELLTGAQAVLGSHFVGMYLFGSLATGGFKPESSDIDFVVVTADELPKETVNALSGLHTRLTTSGLKWVAQLEGVYVPQQTLRRPQADAAPYPQIKEGEFSSSGLGYDWVIQRDVLHRQGVVLAGPPPQTLIDPISQNDLQQAILALFHVWWEPMLNDPAWLHKGENQVFAVLTMCRVLYTLQYGLIESKPVCAHWAQQIIRQHARLIQDALQWNHNITFDRLDETLSFIRYTQNEVALFEAEGVDD